MHYDSKYIIVHFYKNIMDKVYTVLKIEQDEIYHDDIEITVVCSSLNEVTAKLYYDECTRYSREYNEWLATRQEVYNKKNSKSTTQTMLVSLWDIFSPNHYNDFVNHKGVTIKNIKMDKSFVKKYNKKNPFNTTATDYGDYIRFEFKESILS